MIKKHFYVKNANNKLKHVAQFYVESLRLVWNFSLQLHSLTDKEERTWFCRVRKSPRT